MEHSLLCILSLISIALLSAPALALQPVGTGIGGGTGYYEIVTDPQGAQVTLEGTFKVYSPVTVPVSTTGTPDHTVTASMPGQPPGMSSPVTAEVSTTGSPQHTIIASRAGYQTASRSYSGNPFEGETVEIEMTLQPEAQTGSVYVSSSPSPATATINGSDAQQTPCSFSNVVPGYHTVQVCLPGYQAYSASIKVTTGATASVYASLSPVQTWESALRATSSPSGASLYVDGVYRSEARITVYDLATGSHTLRLHLAGYQEWSGSATVASGTATVYSAALTQVQSPTYSAITVHSDPAGASVYLNGNLVDKTPAGSTLDLFSITPDAHTLVMKLPGYQDYSTTVNVASGDIEPESAGVSSRSHPLRR
ncbi:MAG: PEGA domain-containing protein [Methanomicrobiales archaeon]|nr:PEGA domain-containing protein [Methanomicrobiales archaeon]